MRYRAAPVPFLRGAFPLILSLLVAAPAATAQQETGGEVVRPAKLMVLSAAQSQLERDFFGRVRARETVDLAFQVGGQITAFPVVEGRPLEEGALIARLDQTPFEREVARAEVNLDKARRDLTRLEELSDISVTQTSIRDAQTQVDLAEVAVEEARDHLQDATLRTTFPALVARREVATFTTVSAGQPVVRIHDMSELRVDIDVPEILFRNALEGGQGVSFTGRFPGYGETFPLTLREFEAETADIAQTYKITLAFTGAVPDWLLPGASVTVTAQAARGGGARQIVLPETALVFDPDRRPGLMVFDADDDAAGATGTVHWEPVEIEVRDDARVALVSGPGAGTEVVLAGGAQLRDGQTVRRFTGIGD
ncbi:efflux RND transporter periplasmic adaptor subunit [Mesobaculum littorinae]|uniref:Efflux RND transporter periplasmic adaptor subunit n=1 Tax=Mesobaculum littorinae TaxID=2486419 RepID=A0A438AFS5_9RHOB|nr:efflux RND transporter periplasmic adaptor subunit [Mesobaculum littorinae]RVV97538.1 efflux RND transporter periplasmic adaptor subunit [Mesobaculum littorinae]